MKRRNRFLSSIIIFIVVVGSIIYFFNNSKPSSFPSDDELLNKINETYSRAHATVIQDSIFLDDQHVYVPFINSEGSYGSSFWIWKKGKWRVAGIDTIGEPTVWKINESDPKTYHIVWNIPPENNIKNITYYMMKKRTFQVSGKEASYYPQIQMDSKVSTNDKSYGVWQIPSEWVLIMDAEKELESASHPSLLNLEVITHGKNTVFKWIAYNNENEQVYPDYPVNGASFVAEDVNTDFVYDIERSEIESLMK